MRKMASIQRIAEVASIEGADALGLPTVPTLNIQVVPNVAEMLKLAEGKSLLNGSEREGFVLKSLQDPSIIVKVISNKWLLKGGEDQ